MANGNAQDILLRVRAEVDDALQSLRSLSSGGERALGELSSAVDRVRLPQLAEDAAQTAQRLRRELDGLGDEGGDLRRQLGGALEQAERRMDELASSARRADAGIEQIGPEEFRKLQAEVEQTTGELRQAEAAVERFGTAGARGTRSLREGFRSLQGAVAAIGIGLGVRELISYGRAAIQTRRQLDSAKRTIDAVSVSQDEANQRWDEAFDLAQRLGFDVGVLGNRYAALLKASEGVPEVQAEIDEFFRATAESSRTLQLSSSELFEVFRGAEQILSNQTVLTQDLRQITSRLPGLQTQVAEKLGITTAEMRKQLEQGELLAKDIFPALTASMEETAASGLDTALEGLEGTIGRLSAATVSAQNEFAKGLEPALASILARVTEILQANPEFARTLGEVVGKVLELGAAAAEAQQLGEIAGAMADLADAAKSAGPALDVMVPGLTQVLDLLTLLPNQTAEGLRSLAALIRTLQRFLSGDFRGSLEEINRFQAESARQLEDRWRRAQGAVREDVEKTKEAFQEQSLEVQRLAEVAAFQSSTSTSEAEEERRAQIAQTAALAREVSDELIAVEGERVSAVRELAQELQGDLGAILEARIAQVREAAAGEVAVRQELNDKLLAIEEERDAKVGELREKALAELAKKGADEKEIERQLADAIVEVREAAEARKVEVVDAAAEAIVAAAQREEDAQVRAAQAAATAWERAAGAIADALDQGEPGSEDRSALRGVEQQIRETERMLATAEERLRELRSRPLSADEAQEELDLSGQIRELEDQLRQLSQQEATIRVRLEAPDEEDLRSQGQRVADAVREVFGGSQFQEVFEGLEADTQSRVATLVSEFERIAGASDRLDPQFVLTFADAIEDALGDRSPAAIGQLREALGQTAPEIESAGDILSRLAERSREAAGGQREVKELTEEQIPVWDEATRTLSNLAEQTEGGADAQERLRGEVDASKPVWDEASRTLTNIARDQGRAGEGAEKLALRWDEATRTLSNLPEVTEGADRSLRRLADGQQAVGDAADEAERETEELSDATEAGERQAERAADAQDRQARAVGRLAEELEPAAEESGELATNLTRINDQLDRLDQETVARAVVLLEAIARPVTEISEGAVSLAESLTAADEILQRWPELLDQIGTKLQTLEDDAKRLRDRIEEAA